MAELKVLMVCTGNICRSPTAEGVLRAKLQAAGLHKKVEVDSAGTLALTLLALAAAAAVRLRRARRQPLA